MAISRSKFEEEFAKLKAKSVINEDCITRWDIGCDLKEALEQVKQIGKMYTRDFVIDKDNEFVYQNIIKWVHGDRSMQAVNPMTKDLVRGNLKAGLYIAGPAGTGKTMCLNIIRDYSQIIGAKVMIKPFDEKTSLLWKNYNASEIAQEFLTNGDVAEVEKNRILCIQDFGCEPETVVYMGNKVNVLKNLIERRGDIKNRITLITTNLPISHDYTRQRYEERVISRLCQMCNYFELKGKDRRMY